MRLVDGVMTFPVLARGNDSLERSKAAVQQMEAQGQGDLAMVVQRNLSITQGICAVDTLLLVFCVWEVLSFEWWEEERATEEVPAQDLVFKLEMDCFGDSVAR